MLEVAEGARGIFVRAKLQFNQGLSFREMESEIVRAFKYLPGQILAGNLGRPLFRRQSNEHSPDRTI